MSDCSVIIPTYNRRTVLNRAIASALTRTDPPAEIIIVDDASTDGTQALVAGLNDRRIKLIRQECNLGAAAARNAGARAAQSRWLAFLDSDDEWLADKLATQLARLAEAPPAVRASVTGYIPSRMPVLGNVTSFRRRATSRSMHWRSVALSAPVRPWLSLPRHFVPSAISTPNSSASRIGTG